MLNIQCMKSDVFHTTNLQEIWITATKQHKIKFAPRGKDENTMLTFFFFHKLPNYFLVIICFTEYMYFYEYMDLK